MDLLPLPTLLRALPSSRCPSMEKDSLLPQISILPRVKRGLDSPKLRFIDFRTKISGFSYAKSESNAKTIKSVEMETTSKDENLAFVAGATGRVGSRTVRELLKLGFRVRACVRSMERAQSLLQSVNQLKLRGGSSVLETQPVEKLEIIECDLERDAIGPALGKSSMVICCIGASEKEVFDVTGPYRIDYQATKRLIDAATLVKVDHFILLTSLGTNKIGFPASILNLFWGVLIWKRKAEEALIASGLPYTIVRPGGMERPTDAYKETHNLVLANQDTYFGGQVSNLQVAELMAFMAQNKGVSYCKVVEVIAETTAAQTPMRDLLSMIASQRADASFLKVDNKSISQTSQSVAQASTTQEEKIRTGVQKPRPLSPYVVYEDLKPPTSPTPMPSTSPGSPKASYMNALRAESTVIPEVTQISLCGPQNSITVEERDDTKVSKLRPLSPYSVYEDLKPPTSPTPTQSSSNVLKIAQNIATPDLSSLNYGDLKPPNCPMPTQSSPDGRNGGRGNLEPPKASLPKNVQEVAACNSSPLSPYTVYEDLKPPSSPTPEPPLQN